MEKDILQEKNKFTVSLKNLYQILNWIKERILKYFPQNETDKIELAAEEVIVNIIYHAYEKKKGFIEIEIVVNDNLQLIIKDKGPKFNPLEKRKKNIHKKSLKNKKVGGMGIFLIFECVDEVQYQRKNGYNILTLIKKRSQKY